jgi:chemotaxis protein methyltransferase CheR
MLHAPAQRQGEGMPSRRGEQEGERSMKDVPFKEDEAQKLKSYDALCAYLRRASGLVLDSDKRYLVESRVAPIVRREGFSGLTELLRAMERGLHPGLAQEVVQAMTINETYFFRDKLPFDKLREFFLPELIEARSTRRSLRIWCAASSTGQEPYSISMILDEFQQRLAGWRLEIVATDISEAVLTKARLGCYSQFEVQRGLSTAQLLRYFVQTRDGWQVNAAIRSKVTFRQFNLLDDYAVLGQFDLIFCRNVLIYFEPNRKADVLNRMARILADDGVVVLGASESVMGLSTKLAAHPQHRGFFQFSGRIAASPGTTSPGTTQPAIGRRA